MAADTDVFGGRASRPFKYDFFVSYTSREEELKIIQPVVRQFIDHLGEYSSAPFWLDMLQIGQVAPSRDAELRTVLSSAINECVAMLAFVSPEYHDSQFCQFEMTHMLMTSPREDAFVASIEWKAPIRDVDSCDDDFDLMRALSCGVTEVGVQKIPLVPLNIDHIFSGSRVDLQRSISRARQFLRNCRRNRLARWRHLQGTRSIVDSGRTAFRRKPMPLPGISKRELRRYCDYWLEYNFSRLPLVAEKPVFDSVYSIMSKHLPIRRAAAKASYDHAILQRPWANN